MRITTAHSAGVRGWAVPQGVLWCSDGHQVAILSLISGRYYTLNDVAAFIWRCLPECSSIEDVAARVAERYVGANDADIWRDARELTASLERSRLIVRTQPAQRSGALQSPRLTPRATSTDSFEPVIPSLSACLTKLMCAHALLRVSSLSRLLSVIGAATGTASSSVPCGDWFPRTIVRLSHAGALYPFRTLCRERSVCLWWLARAAGLDARLRLGVVPSPFSAHAWVEYRGEPVNETREHLSLYRVFPEF